MSLVARVRRLAWLRGGPQAVVPWLLVLALLSAQGLGQWHGIVHGWHHDHHIDRHDQAHAAVAIDGSALHWAAPFDDHEDGDATCRLVDALSMADALAAAAAPPIEPPAKHAAPDARPDDPAQAARIDRPRCRGPPPKTPFAIA